MTNTAGAERPTRRRSGRPKCAGKLRDGTTCNNSAKPNSDLCGQCQYRQANGGDLLEAVPVAWDDDAEERPEVEGIAPEQFREQLAEDLAEDYNLAVTALREAMQHSSRRGKAQCPKCNTRIPVDIPDHGARIKAVQTWTELGLGRIRESNADEKKNGGQQRHAFTRHELENMTVDELARLCAADDPLETTAENIAASATTNPDGTAIVPAAVWQAFLEARKEWGKVVAAR